MTGLENKKRDEESKNEEEGGGDKKETEASKWKTCERQCFLLEEERLHRCE